jgi:pyruvate dehydrogenase E2 component (dihydrolipoamide acetyltransferase)
MALRDPARWKHLGNGVYVRNLEVAESDAPLPAVSAAKAAQQLTDLVQGDEEEVNATPAAIEAAEELGVDLTEIEGSGKKGKVTKADVEALASE